MSKKSKTADNDGWLGVTIKATAAENNAFMQYQVDAGIIQPQEPYSVKCKFCNESGFRWVKDTNGRWALYTRENKPHLCLTGDDEPF